MTLDLEAIRKRREAAERALYEACRTGRVTMCIPVQPTDTDVLIADALADIGLLLAEIDRLRAKPPEETI
jgi:hypothetical protein